MNIKTAAVITISQVIKVHIFQIFNLVSIIMILAVLTRLDFQSFCAPAFLRAHYDWITGLPYCIFDQSETPARIVQASL